MASTTQGTRPCCGSQFSKDEERVGHSPWPSAVLNLPSGAASEVTSAACSTAHIRRVSNERTDRLATAPVSVRTRRCRRRGCTKRRRARTRRVGRTNARTRPGGVIGREAEGVGRDGTELGGTERSWEDRNGGFGRGRHARCGWLAREGHATGWEGGPRAGRGRHLGGGS